MEKIIKDGTAECSVCQNETQVIEFKGKKVCSECIQEIKTQ